MTKSLAARISRCPRPFDTDHAADAQLLVGDLSPELATAAVNMASASPYLRGLLERESDWLAEASLAPEAAFQTLLLCLNALPPDQIAPGLRQAKRRVALLCALADLAGAWTLEEVTQTLSDFADRACHVALKGALALQLRRNKLPGVSQDDLERGAGMVVLAMGKMGAGELNYSSDIDLICLFDETQFEPDSYHDVRSAFVKATRAMAATLSELTADGYVFRTDLRLRPDPSVTPVCLSMEAAERYYESLGRTWERAAYIKARPAAGDLAAGAQFLKTMRPFVWRKHLDFAAIQDAHDMRLAIKEHKGLGGAIDLAGHNMKLGRGGIREIEFFTQTRQLIAGGRDPDLRLRGTCEGLAMLAQKGWIEGEICETLTRHYRFHRTVEHRLQMVRDAQTHSLPTSAEGFSRIAAMMDMDENALRTDLGTRLKEVHQLTEGFFAPGSGQPTPEGAHQFDEALIESWRSYPAMRSARAADLFNTLKPQLLKRLAGAAKPDEALLAFDGFLAGLPAGVQLFSLLQANPQLADLLIDIVTTSPALAAHLSRNAGVLDAVIGGDFFTDWPGQEALKQDLADLLSDEADYEAQLDATRRWAKEWHFRIGVHLLRGLITAAQAGSQYAHLARAVLCGLWPVVIAQFSRRHGPPPGRGAAIVGMGSLGAGCLTPSSDLDMLVIYDPGAAEQSTGARPLATRQYYARLTQAMITAMTAPMAQGRLYEVDMRLRPSGNKGPVATSITSFESYQKTEAWVWEHLALTRAACIVGPQALMAEIESLRQEILQASDARAKILNDVSDMRARIADAKSPSGIWDAKIGQGRLQDIELFAQAGMLMQGGNDRSVAQGLTAAQEAQLITQAEGAQLAKTYAQCWALQCATRLLSPEGVSAENLGNAGADFLLRALGYDAIDQAMAQLTQIYDTAAAIISRSLQDVRDNKEYQDAES